MGHISDASRRVESVSAARADPLGVAAVQHARIAVDTQRGVGSRVEKGRPQHAVDGKLDGARRSPGGVERSDRESGVAQVRGLDRTALRALQLRRERDGRLVPFHALGEVVDKPYVLLRVDAREQLDGRLLEVGAGVQEKVRAGARERAAAGERHVWWQGKHRSAEGGAERR